MTKKRITLFTIIMLLTVILFAMTSALSAGNSVPVTRLSDQAYNISIIDLAPPECAGLNLANIIYASGFTIGTNAGDLMLGSPSGEVIFGGRGEDCIVGGGGNDILLGDRATDVCIGGPGNDSFRFLFWGGCETQIQ